MFLVVDNTRRKIRNIIQTRFNELNLPCIISDLDHCDLYMPAAIIIVTERYLLEPVKYFAKIYDDSPVFLWDEHTDFLKFAFDKYLEVYGIEIFNSFKSRITVGSENVYFANRRIWMTVTERRIFNYIFYFPGYHDKELIAKYCLKRGSKDMDSVPVHISNINAKAKRATYSKLISVKRYKGYFI